MKIQNKDTETKQQKSYARVKSFVFWLIAWDLGLGSFIDAEIHRRVYRLTSLLQFY